MSHPWKFFRAGGFDQVSLTRAADLLALDELDQKLWVALSCPVAGLDFDGRTLAYVDRDGDGYIRAPELIAAVQWAAARLKDPELLLEAPRELPLAAIAEPPGEADAPLRSAAQRILAVLGKAADTISLADTEDHYRLTAAAALNGDGVVTPGSTQDATLAALITDLVTATGGVPDRSGEAGIDAATLDGFLAGAQQWLDWAREGETLPTLGTVQGEQPGVDAQAAWEAFSAVREKIDDWFTRVALAGFDPLAAGAMNPPEEAFRQLAGGALQEEAEAIAALPLARVEAGAALPLQAGINPAWARRLAHFSAVVVSPLLGERQSLSATDWANLRATLATRGDWAGREPATLAAPWGRERLEALVSGPLPGQLHALIAEDAALAPEFAAFADVDKLLRYVAHLHRLTENFVNFRAFYDRRPPGKGGAEGAEGASTGAIFQAGTLYLDGRSTELCITVTDAARHAALAGLSRIFLVYCDCVRGDAHQTIAAGFTAGDADQLMVGRNGLFYDRQGQDWRATIVRIVDHPISLRQAFWSPYRKLARFVGEQAQKFAAAKDKAVEDQQAALVTQGGKQLETPPVAAKAPAPAAPTAPAAPPFDVGRFAGIFAAIGLAIGALGTALASVVTGFLGLKVWQMPLALAGLLLIISGPAVLLAWFKLRSRTLGPLLDANGWAVNTRARINIAFGTSLTQLASLPDGAERTLADPFADRKIPWGPYLFLLIVLGGLLYYVLAHLG